MFQALFTNLLYYCRMYNTSPRTPSEGVACHLFPYVLYRAPYNHTCFASFRIPFGTQRASPEPTPQLLNASSRCSDVLAEALPPEATTYYYCLVLHGMVRILYGIGTNTLSNARISFTIYIYIEREREILYV